MSKDIPQNIRDIADALKPEISFDTATGHATADNAEAVFNKFLPESLPVEHVTLVQDHLIDFAAAHALAVGERSLEVLKEHSELKSTSLKSKVGHFGYETSVERERSGTAMGKEWRKRGIVNTDVIVGQGRRRSAHKAVVSYIGEQAESVFGN